MKEKIKKRIYIRCTHSFIQAKDLYLHKKVHKKHIEIKHPQNRAAVVVYLCFIGDKRHKTSLKFNFYNLFLNFIYLYINFILRI